MTGHKSSQVIELTALILTYNEEENIGRTLASLRWLPQVLIIDSYSDDATLEIAEKYPNVSISQHTFGTFASQCQHGLSLIKTEWVLSLDADYVLTSELVEEIKNVPGPRDIAGYRARFRYCIYGAPLRRTLLPPRTVLYRRANASYYAEGHGHRVRIDGKTGELNGYILHDDRKPLQRWYESQIRYAELEARYLLGADSELSVTSYRLSGEEKGRARELSVQDKVRKMIFVAPVIMPVYLLIGYGLILDGWRGWYYAFQRTVAELLLSLRLLEAKLQE